MMRPGSPIRRSLAAVVDVLTLPRGRFVAIACPIAIAIIFLLATFDTAFLFGRGAFWANPVGPWLQDANDTIYNRDVVNMLVGYYAFLHTGWHLPLFLVPGLGTPSGTNIIFLDAIPPVALFGKIVSELAGSVVNPYGIWVALCFILLAVLASLVVREAGQRSLLAATAASILVITAPPLLHRFGHFVLMSHFLVVGSLLLYLRDQQPAADWIRTGRWVGWLCLAALVNPYLFAMCGAIYAAAWLRRFGLQRPSFLRAAAEPAMIIVALGLIAAISGHFGRGTGTSPFGGGFGRYSMNLASPLWPQRSGLFPGLQAIVDATDGQYEGFSYLGFGAILLVAIALVRNAAELRAMLARHRYLGAALACLLLFALSDRVFLGHLKLLDVYFSWRVNHVLGLFRSSGRMFWPVFYVIVLFGVIGTLRRLSPAAGVLVVLACCVLQLADTNPLRARLSQLTETAVPTLIDQTGWDARMSRAAEVQLDPSYQCKGGWAHTPAITELQLAAAIAGRPINSVYNARLEASAAQCDAASAAARDGPWRSDVLYVFLSGDPKGVPAGWMPKRQSCEPFTLGAWCLGPAGPAP